MKHSCSLFSLDGSGSQQQGARGAGGDTAMVDQQEQAGTSKAREGIYLIIFYWFLFLHLVWEHKGGRATGGNWSKGFIQQYPFT